MKNTTAKRYKVARVYEACGTKFYVVDVAKATVVSVWKEYMKAVNLTRDLNQRLGG